MFLVMYKINLQICYEKSILDLIFLCQTIYKRTEKTKKCEKIWKSDTMQSFKDLIYLSRRNGIFSHFFQLVWKQLRTRYGQKLCGTLKLQYQWNFSKICLKISQKISLKSSSKAKKTVSIFLDHPVKP